MDGYIVLLLLSKRRDPAYFPRTILHYPRKTPFPESIWLSITGYWFSDDNLNYDEAVPFLQLSCSLINFYVATMRGVRH